MALVLVGVLAGAVVYIPTGYTIASAADLFGFRAAPLAKRLLIAVPVGLIILPILVYWAGRVRGLYAMTAVLLPGLLGVAVVTLRERPRWPELRRELNELVPRYRWCLIGAAAWAILIAVCFSDLEIGGTLYTS